MCLIICLRGRRSTCYVCPTRVCIRNETRRPNQFHQHSNRFVRLSRLSRPCRLAGLDFFVVVFGINACARTLARLMVIALVGERRTQGMLAQSAAATAATTGSPCLMRKGLFIDYMCTKYPEMSRSSPVASSSFWFSHSLQNCIGRNRRWCIKHKTCTREH